MSSQVRQPFTPGGKFVVTRAFRYAGKDYSVGDEFPWRRLSCSVRRLRQLYEGRNLNNFFFNEEEVAFNANASSTGGGGGVDEIPCISTFDPELHDIINPEKGEWYVVDETGARLLKLAAKEAKRLRKAVEKVEINPEMIEQPVIEECPDVEAIELDGDEAEE